MASSSRIYTCEFYNHDNRVKRLYEIAFEILPCVQGKYRPDEHPIRVHTINGTPIANGYAVAVKSKCEYMGTVLFSILLNRVSYVAGIGDIQYWFPLCERQAELVDGSIRVHTTDTKDMEIVFLTPLDTLPFMDATGTFVYQYTMVSQMNMLTPKGHVFPELNTPMTLYQSGDKFRIMQDNTTMVKYKIEGVTTFREMPFYDLQ
jgi:hypothetical protein